MKPKEPRGGPLEMRLAPLKSLLAASVLFVCGCKVTQPGVVEKEMAKEVKHKITVGGKDDVNPIPATEANIADGREHFGHHCGICHGLDGQATGVPFADKMSPPVPFPFREGSAGLRRWPVEMDYRQWHQPVGNAGLERLSQR